MQIDLPVPEPPMMTIELPLLTCRLRPRRTWLSPKLLCTFSKVIMGLCPLWSEGASGGSLFGKMKMDHIRWLASY